MEDGRQNEKDGFDANEELNEELPAAVKEAQAAQFWEENDKSGQEEYQQNSCQEPDHRAKKQSSLPLASLIMGIIGMATSFCGFGGLLFGCLGIVFAQLSKTSDAMDGYAKFGLITSILSVIMAVVAFTLLRGTADSLLQAGGGF